MMTHREKQGTTFHITIREVYSNGQSVTKFIGKEFHSRYQLKKALKKIRITIPEAKSGRYVAYFQ